LEPFKRVHIGVQGTGTDPAIQGDGQTGGIPGEPVRAVVLVHGALSAGRPFLTDFPEAFLVTNYNDVIPIVSIFLVVGVVISFAQALRVRRLN
jgi:hypothetical protein